METKQEYYNRLNERFDSRVLILISKGYKYYKEQVCFARSDNEANKYSISNCEIMHCDDYHFNNIINY